MDFISSIKNYLCPDRIIAPACMSSDTDICPVCQMDLNETENEEDRIKYTTPCGHTYHHKCVRQWFENKDTCPSCRATVITSNIRCSCTKYEYVKPKKEMNYTLFFYYLIGGSSHEYKDVDMMMSMALQKIYTLKYDIFTTFTKSIFFAKHRLTESEIKESAELLSKISKYLEICAIIISFLRSSFVSGPFVTNWFRILLMYQIAHYEGNFCSFKHSKKVFYDNGINPIYFILYVVVVLLKIPLFVLPSYIIFRDPHIKNICYFILSLFIIKYILHLFDIISIILMTFYKLRISLGDVIRREFNGESTPLSMYTQMFNSSVLVSNDGSNISPPSRQFSTNPFSDPSVLDSLRSRRSSTNISGSSNLSSTTGIDTTLNDRLRDILSDSQNINTTSLQLSPNSPHSPLPPHLPKSTFPEELTVENTETGDDTDV